MRKSTAVGNPNPESTENSIMYSSHLPQAALAYHGIHLVARTEKTAKPPLVTPALAYKIAAAGAALLLTMTVC